jgi:hypothetical protein
MDIVRASLESSTRLLEAFHPSSLHGDGCIPPAQCLQVEYIVQWLQIKYPSLNWRLRCYLLLDCFIMKLFSVVASLVSLSTSLILQNGQLRETNYPNTQIATIDSNSTGWKTYAPNAAELSYKGRWDSKHISWWAYAQRATD